MTRDYGLYWSSSLSVLFGLWVQRLTVAWLAWEMTSFGFWLGLVATIDPLMRIFLDQIAVLLAGCRNRKRMTLQCQSANIVVVLALAFLLSFGQLDQYGFLAFAILNSIISVIQQPVQMPLTATLIEKSQILKAVTRMTIIAYLGRFVAPMIVGPVLAFVETITAFFASACLFRFKVVQLPFINARDQGHAI